MKAEEVEAVEQLSRDETQRFCEQPSAPAPERQTIPFTELPEDTSASSTAQEWNFYRREVGQLLAEGHEGKWVLIKGGQIIGIWDTRDEAKAVALERYSLQPVLIQQVLSRMPVLRGPTFFRLWRS
ncbi:MAG TPA: hypothetical protein VE988_28105 [Gemmataceae bacterium]|nr:hypothetical protein [Gemmataceae bacterium]